MKKAKYIIVGNWKMNPESPEEARAIFSGIKRAAEKTRHVLTVICPPFIYLPLLAKNLSKNLARNSAKNKTPKILLGAQNVFQEFAGAHTGEISPVMLARVGATHVIVGHSERRAQGETDEIVNKKVLAALREDLNVVLCVGETKRDTEGGYLMFIKQQIVSALAKVQKKYLFNLIIAYEPIWAIGKNERDAMRGRDMHEMAIYLRKILSELYDAPSASHVPILYGGSVAPFNTEDIVKEGHVNGLLVGRESLNPAGFGEILRIVDGIKGSE